MRYHNRQGSLLLRWALLTGASMLGLPAFAGSDFVVRNGTVAGGGGIGVAGSYRLIGTIGEPASGTIFNEVYRLTSGYPATIGDVNQGAPIDGRIFADGFEEGGVRL